MRQAVLLNEFHNWVKLSVWIARARRNSTCRCDILVWNHVVQCDWSILLYPIAYWAKTPRGKDGRRNQGKFSSSCGSYLPTAFPLPLSSIGVESTSIWPSPVMTCPKAMKIMNFDVVGWRVWARRVESSKLISQSRVLPRTDHHQVD